MFQKAKELTDYKDNAFELVYFEHESNVSLPEKALKKWKKGPETGIPHTFDGIPVDFFPTKF